MLQRGLAPLFGHNGAPPMGLDRLSFRTFDGVTDARTMDSSGAFLQSELERLDPILHQPLAGFTYLRDIPLREDVTFEDESSSFASVGYASPGGIAPSGIAWVGKTATAITGIQADVGKVVTPLNLWAMELGYTVAELASSQRVNRPIDRMKLDGLNLKANQDADMIGYVGDTYVNSYGLTNSPDVSVTNAPNGASGSATFAQKTQDEILADVNFMLMQSYAATGYTLVPDTIGLPPTQYGRLSRVNSSAGSVSILNYLKTNTFASEKNGRELSIVDMKWLVGRGVGGTDRMIAYTRDPSRVRLPLTPMQNTPIQYRGLHYLTYYYRRLGAVEITNPQTMFYLDGI